MRLYALPLLLALVAAFHTLVPKQAEAATGLFAVRRIFYSDQVGQGNRTRTVFFPTATGYVGTTSLPRFTVPQSVIKDTTGYEKCFPGICRAGYPQSKAWYSYWNLRGSFRPNNPYGATMTTTVRFNTTMGNTGPPLGTGDPVTPTTTFDGRYDFRRAGSIMITPGPNRFGGTMQFFYGPNHRFYQFNTIFSVYASKAYGNGPPAISTDHESHVGEFVIGRQMDRYWLTTFGYQRYLIGSTPGGGFCTMTSATPGGAPLCEYYLLNVQYISTIVPFTTGMITGYQPLGYTTTVHTLTGYDNRTPAGLNGMISLVRPRLVQRYLVPWVPNEPPWKTTSSLSTWQIDFHFLPEPGGSAMMAAGVVALAGLYRRRRHSVER